MTGLVLEVREQRNETIAVGPLDVFMAADVDYWMFRVRVSEHQAVLGFPKFATIGIGFAVEEDWNTNLPYTSDTGQIWEYIRDNKGDDEIPDERCIEAIRMVQDAARRHMAAVPR